MDVEATAERIVPTANFIKVAHPHMPTVEKVMQIDGSVDHTHTFEVSHEPNDLTSKAPLEFIIHQTPNYYVDLQSFYIDVKLRMTKADGSRANVEDWPTYFVNNLSQSLWSVVKVYLNDVCIQSNYDNQQESNLTHILTTPNTVTEERGLVQGAFPITPDTHNGMVDAGRAAVESVVQRIAWSKTGEVHVRGPLHLDLDTCQKFLVDGVRIKIVLEPSSIPFLIKAAVPAGQTYEYQLKSVKLLCTKIKPTATALLATSKSIMSRPIEYLMRRNIFHKEVIPVGYRDYTATRPFQDLIPNKLYIYMVDREAAMGHLERDPYYYTHFRLNHYSVKINGIQVAGGPVDNECLIKEYVESTRAHGGDYFIPYANYTKGCFVLCVNTNDQSQYNDINIEKKGNLTVTLQFAHALPRTILLHVSGTVDTPFEIDMDRNVSTSFQH